MQYTAPSELANQPILALLTAYNAHSIYVAILFYVLEYIQIII